MHQRNKWYFLFHRSAGVQLHGILFNTKYKDNSVLLKKWYQQLTINETARQNNNVAEKNYYFGGNYFERRSGSTYLTELYCALKVGLNAT